MIAKKVNAVLSVHLGIGNKADNQDIEPNDKTRGVKNERRNA